MKMKLGELKAIIDSLYELHGPDSRTDFVFQKASGRTGVDVVTKYETLCSSPIKTVRFTIGHARGKQE